MKKKSSDPPALAELFFSFAKVGAMTFGGGYAMLPIMQREIVENKHWADDEYLANCFAIAQCTPGAIAVNTATFLGYKKRGVIGGIVATLGVVFPSIVIITALAGVIGAFDDSPCVVKAFMGVRACVVALILNAILKLWKSAVTGKITMIVFLAVLALTLVFDLSPIILVAADILFGILMAFIAGKEKEKV